MTFLTRLIAVFGFAAGTAAAQPPQGPPPGGPLDIERLAVLLDLDAYQEGEVERVLNAQRDARLKARAELDDSGDPPSREDIRARREQDRAQVLEQLKNILTQQQMTKLELLMEPPRGGRGGPSPF
jgi:Spy/CpxP family protein refolding chaperone